MSVFDTFNDLQCLSNVSHLLCGSGLEDREEGFDYIWNGQTYSSSSPLCYFILIIFLYLLISFSLLRADSCLIILLLMISVIPITLAFPCHVVTILKVNFEFYCHLRSTAPLVVQSY